MNLLINSCLALFVLDAVLMILVILMQRPKSEGLGAAFGAAVTENIFGAQTTNVLTRITSWLAGVFFVLTFALAVLYAHHSTRESGLRSELMKTQGAAAASPAPAASVVGVSPAPPSASVSPVSSPGTGPKAGVSPASTVAPLPASAATTSASPGTSPSPRKKL